MQGTDDTEYSEQDRRDSYDRMKDPGRIVWTGKSGTGQQNKNDRKTGQG